MRVLVTGATGFLGYHLCRRLVEQGHDVAGFHRSTSRPGRLRDLGIRCISGDLAEPNSLRDRVRGHEAVIHAAADISYGAKDPSAQERVNVAGTANVAQACRLEGVSRLLYVSSTSAIGIPHDAGTPANEDFSFNLEGTGLRYHISKRKAELAVAGEVARGLDAVVVNPSSIFGPHGVEYRGGTMISKVRYGRLASYFAGGICAVHVEDVVSGILSALKNGVTGSRYILGGENVTYREIAQRAMNAIGVKKPLIPVPPLLTAFLALASTPIAKMTNQAQRFSRSSHFCSSRFLYYSSEKARAALSYRPRGFDAILYECLGNDWRVTMASNASWAALETQNFSGSKK